MSAPTEDYVDVLLANDMLDIAPISIRIGDTRYDMSAKNAREIAASLIRAANYTDDWRRWRFSKGCN